MLIYVRCIWELMQCPHYSGCPFFRGVHKAGLRCSIFPVAESFADLQTANRCSVALTLHLINKL